MYSFSMLTSNFSALVGVCIQSSHHGSHASKLRGMKVAVHGYNMPDRTFFVAVLTLLKSNYWC